MRITPDTGILVRMNVKAAGPARRLLEIILAGPHELVLSEFLLEETARVLCYPRLQKLYGLAWEDIVEHVELLRARADLVSPIVYEPIVFTDPNDDPVVYTAVAGRSDVLCALDRDFYTPQVISFCSERGIEILNDVELLERLKQEHMA
jgi:putative PIN family toxin of toxin-antitoxin system